MFMNAGFELLGFRRGMNGPEFAESVLQPQGLWFMLIFSLVALGLQSVF